MARFRQQWPGLSVVFHGNSGFCRLEMLRLCERNGVDYIMGIARDSRLEVFGAKLRENAARLFEDSKENAKLFGEFMYRVGTLEADRRVIAKAEYNDKSLNICCVMTSLPGDKRYLYEKVYCA